MQTPGNTTREIHSKDNPSTNTAIIIAVMGFIFLLFLITIILIFLLISRNSQSNTEVSLTQEEIVKITSQVSFSDQGDSEFVYSSPINDFSVQIDTTKYNYTETSTGISIYPKQYDDYSTIRVSVEKPFSDTYEFELQKELDNYKNSISFYNNSEIVNEETATLSGSDAHKIEYTRSSYGGNTTSVLATLSVYENKLYKIEYTLTGESELDRDLYDSIINNFDYIDSSQIDATANYNSSIWGYSFNYDSKYWELDSSSQRTIYLSPRRIDYSEESPKVELNISAEEISRLDLVGNESTYLETSVDERIQSLQDNENSYPGFNLVEKRNEDIGGKNAITINYQVDAGSYRYQDTIEYWVIHNNSIVRIALNYEGYDSLPGEVTEIFNTIEFIEPTSGQVKGVTNTESIIGIEEKVAIQAKPSVVRIYNKSCTEISLAYDARLPLSSGKSYELCSAGSGSGFFVNSEGYVATNGHVVITSKDDLLYNSIFYGFNQDLLLSLFRDLYEDAVLANTPGKYFLTNEEAMGFLSSRPDVRREIALLIVNTYNQPGAPAIQQTSEIFVQKANTPMVFGVSADLENGTSHFSAELIDYNYDPEDKEFLGDKSDIALLKVNTPGDYPVISLMEEDVNNVNIGSSLLVIGFPGVATDINFVETDSQGEETVTRGIVSAVKETTGGRFLIQTDASVQHGNSGGPGLNNQANAVGVVSLGINDTGAADYNFLRDVQDLRDIMTENQVTNTIGITEINWREGLELFWQGEFELALESFEKAKASFPNLTEADSFITISEDKIAQGIGLAEDETNESAIFDFVNDLSETEQILFVLVGVLLCLVSIMFLMVMILMGRSSRNRRDLRSQ